MPLTHERGVDRLVKLPSESSAIWKDDHPWPANLHMILASNAGHLAKESLRQLVADNTGGGFALSGKSDTWEGLDDAVQPDATSLAAATPDYRKISWAPLYTLAYGPSFVPFDRATSDGRLVLRRIKGRVEYSQASGNLLLVVVLTAHDNPEAIATGDVLAYSSVSRSGAVDTTLDFNFAVDIEDRQSVPFYSRESAGSARVATYLLPVYLWVGVSASAGATVHAVSAWEAPD